MVEKNRAELISELEGLFKKRVFALIFNPGDDEGIKEGDEKYIFHFLKGMNKNHLPLDSVWIISGRGGNLKTAILCSELLRKNLKRYDTFVPTVVGSALCYFILQSDKLLIGEKSRITQMDPMFDYDGEDLRAIKHLASDDPRKSTIAKAIYNPVFENVKKLIIEPPNVFEEKIQKTSKNKTNYLVKVVDLWMGKELHESGLTKTDLEKLGVKFKILDPNIIEKAKILINDCLRELEKENQRFVIQTNEIENDCYFGGYFYS
ncbi:MAG: hypothetical protein NTX24_00195 [Candidatus Pacearchaeota archaeon]|nr:hypothetical protein [Candidatus Pacearchaeota archaeon]